MKHADILIWYARKELSVQVKHPDIFIWCARKSFPLFPWFWNGTLTGIICFSLFREHILAYAMQITLQITLELGRFRLLQKHKVFKQNHPSNHIEIMNTSLRERCKGVCPLNDTYNEHEMIIILSDSLTFTIFTQKQNMILLLKKNLTISIKQTVKTQIKIQGAV